MSNPVSDLKQELLAAAERQHARGAVRVDSGRPSAVLGQNRLVVAAATLAIAAAAALLMTTPWNEPQGLLERAQAALTPPAGTILHQKWKVTSTSTDPACAVTWGPNEIWIDETPPYRFRALLKDPVPTDPASVDPDAILCTSGTATELGGTLEPMETLRFVPPNTLSASSLHFVHPLNPVADLREAISEGRAQDEGKTQLDGRTVERIRLDPPTDCFSCSNEPGYVYVDPETFYPIQEEGPHGRLVLPGRPVVTFHVVNRILTFEYLPRTEPNLELTDIRAQHPAATGP